MAGESTTSPGIPVPAAQPVPESRAVGAGRGWAWWVEGWRLFTPSWGPWLAISLILCVLVAVGAMLGMVPFLGQLASLAGEVLWPVLIGGLMLGCRAIDRGNPLLVAHLFAGFSQRLKPLATAGAIYTGLLIVISLLIGGMMVAIFGIGILNVLSGETDPTQSGIAFSSAVVAVLLGFLFFLLLLVPLIMAIWFAPALIMLAGVGAIDGLKASFAGCLRNILPFLVYGVVGLALMIVASIPFGLGWLVLAPVAIASLYASYCDIYEDRDNV
jgi:uncharacterized membrane protein